VLPRSAHPPHLLTGPHEVGAVVPVVERLDPRLDVPTCTSHCVDVSQVPHPADVLSPPGVGGMGCPVGFGLEPAQNDNAA
jgi:hypothetical protein